MRFGSRLLLTVVLWMAAVGLSGVATGADNRVLMAVPAAPAAANETRVALVIGNSAYKTGPLKNPANDASDVAKKLQALGFEVIVRTNLRTAHIGRTLREFRAKLVPGAVALVFYAGHGVQVRGENFLPTVDAEIEGEEDVYNQSLGLRQIMDLLDESKTRLNLVFLDACRNNPFLRRYRSAGDGLARVQAPSGTLISYATRPGSVASDGDGRNGLYTEHLLEVMDTANLPIEQSLKRIVSGVKAGSRGQQEPWMEGSIEGDFYFLQRAVPAAPSPEAQHDAIARAVEEATRRANEQATQARAANDAARRSAEQAERERAVEEAVRRANEQAARERAELQASMQRMIQEALVQQTARIEAERRAAGVPAAVAPGASAPAAPSARPAVPAVPAAAPSQPVASRLAMLTPSVTAQPGASAESPGEEARYRSTGLGKEKTLVIFTPNGASNQHEIRFGKSVQEFDAEKNLVVGAPNEGEILFSPRWHGEFRELTSTLGSGSGRCAAAGACRVTVRPAGTEKLTVPAGSFDAVRLDGWINVSLRVGVEVSGTISVWYSQPDRRLLKQSINLRDARLRETLELEHVGKAAPRTPVAVDVAGELDGSRAHAGNLRFDNVSAGDEWEYLATDKILGKKRTLLWRVLAVAEGKGVLEEYRVNGRKAGEWVANGSANLVGLGDVGILLMPHWLPSDSDTIVVTNFAQGYAFMPRVKIKGPEKITVAAGAFETTRIVVDLALRNPMGFPLEAQFDVWYSPNLKRVIKQSGKMIRFNAVDGQLRFDDSFELVAVRTAKPN